MQQQAHRLAQWRVATRAYGVLLLSGLGAVAVFLWSHRQQLLRDRLDLALLTAGVVAGMMTSVAVGGRVRHILVGLIMTGRGQGSSPISKVTQPPGSTLLTIVEFIASRQSCERVFRPMIYDMRIEVFDALAQGRVWKARWIHVRGTVALVNAALLRKLLCIARLWEGGFASIRNAVREP